MAIITPTVRKVFKDGDVVTAEIINDIIDTLLDKDTIHANIENGTANGTLVQKGTNTNNKASYENSAAFGRGHTTSRLNQFVAGEYSAGNSKAIAIFGNGKSGAPKNALEVLEDGRLKIQTSPIENNDAVRLIDLDEKLANLGTDITSTSSARCGSYQGADWYRLAKVINTEHIASGIFVVEIYQCNENLINLLSVSKFSVVCGVDEKDKFIEDVTPLAQYPREFTQGDGEDNGGSGGSNGYKEYGLVSVRIENSDDGIFVTGLLSNPLMFDDSYLLMRFSINNNLNFQVLVDENMAPTRYAKDNEVLDLTTTMNISPATPINYIVDVYYDYYHTKLMGGGSGTQYSIKNNSSDVIFGFKYNMTNSYTWTFCNHENTGNIYPINLQVGAEYQLIKGNTYIGKLTDLFNSLYMNSISTYGKVGFSRLNGTIKVIGPCSVVINDSVSITSYTFAEGEEGSIRARVYNENVTIQASGANNFTVSFVPSDWATLVGISDTSIPVLRFTFKNTFSASSKAGTFSNDFSPGYSGGIRGVKARYLYGVESELSNSYELYSIDEKLNNLGDSIDEKLNNLDDDYLRDDDDSVFRIVKMNPPSATAIDNLTFLDVINAITSKIGSLNRCLLQIIGYRTYTGIVIIGYQGGDNYNAYTISIPSLKVCSGTFKASETKFFDFVNGNNANTTYLPLDGSKPMSGDIKMGQMQGVTYNSGNGTSTFGFADDGFPTILNTQEPSINISTTSLDMYNTYTFPEKSGTVVLTDDLESFVKRSTLDDTIEGDIKYDNHNGDTLKIWEKRPTEDDETYGCFIDLTSDYYRTSRYSADKITFTNDDGYSSHYDAVGFKIGNYAYAELDVEELNFTIGLGEDEKTSLYAGYVNVYRNGNALEMNSDGFTKSLNNFETSYDIQLPNKSGTIALLEDIGTGGGATGDYLPLTAGSSKPLTGVLHFTGDAQFASTTNIFRFGDTTNRQSGAVLANSGNTKYFRPGESGTMDLGNTSYKWKDIYAVGKTYLHNGNATGALTIGANVNASTLSNNTRKLARITAPVYENTSNVAGILSYDSGTNTGTNVLAHGVELGSRTGDTSSYGLDYISMSIAKEHNAQNRNNVAQFVKDKVQFFNHKDGSTSIEQTPGPGLKGMWEFTNDNKFENNGYKYTLPNKEGTIALLEDLENIGGGVSEEDVLNIIEDNSLEVDSYSIGTKATYDIENDSQIPTTKAVKDMIDQNVPANVVTKDEDGHAEINGIYNISSLDSRDEKSGIMFNNFGYEVLLYSEEAKIGLATPDMIDGGDIEHFIHFPDTGRTNGNGTLNSFEWYLPRCGGTILTDSMAISTNENITTYKNLVVYSDDDSDSDLQPKNNDDIDTTYYSKGILLYNNDTGEEHRLYYPEKTGTIALLEDLENIGGGGASGATQLKLVATGTRDNSIDSDGTQCVYSLDTTLSSEAGKLYYIKRYSDMLGLTTGTVVGFQHYASIPVTEYANDESINAQIILRENDVHIICYTEFANDELDELEVYEIQSMASTGASGGLKLVSSGKFTMANYNCELLIENLTLKDNTLYALNIYNNPDGAYDKLMFYTTTNGLYDNNPVLICDENEEYVIGNLVYEYNKIIRINSPYGSRLIYEDGANYELYEVQGGSSGGSGNTSASGGLKLVESGTTTYGDTSIQLQKNPFEKEKVYIINVKLEDGSISFIYIENKYGVSTSSTPYFDPLDSFLSISYVGTTDSGSLYVSILSTKESAVFEDGTYEIYELAGGTSSAGAKLRKENYIDKISRRSRVVSDFEDGVISEEPFIEFTQPVDIVVETPRTKTFKTNTASKPSLYRPIGGQRVFTEREYLTFADIFELLSADLSTISEVYNPSQSSQGKGCRYLVFRDSQYSVENRLLSENIDVKGYYNSRVMRDFFIRERWVSKQMTFILKPVINYEEIENDYGNHYTYLTGSHAIEIQIILSYNNNDGKNPNDNLQYLINYKIVELD